LGDLADAAASRDGPARGTEGVILHAPAVKKDVVADEEYLLEDIEGEARGVAVDVESLNSLVDEVFFEGMSMVDFSECGR
jgi:hypothetical protein